MSTEDKVDEYCAESVWLDSTAMVCSATIVDGRCPWHGTDGKRLPVKPSQREDELTARLAEVEAERDAAVMERDQLRSRLTRVKEQRDTWHTMWQEVRRELEAARPVVEAADAWRGENNGKGLVLPPASDRIDALITAVDLHRSIRNLDSTTPEPSFATETLRHPSTTEEKP